MKIYINESFEIKAIGASDDDTLTEIIVDESSLLNNLSDFMIFNYCCRPLENGYEIYPNIDYNILKLLDNQENKISILEAEQKKQQEEILQNMLATTEVFEMILTMSAPMSVDIQTKNLGGNSMVEVYVTLILNGVKTIDQVPTILREKVREQLNLLVK